MLTIRAKNKNKPRVYIALYLRSGHAPAGSYHWAISPKAATKTGTNSSPLDAVQYHVKNVSVANPTTGMSASSDGSDGQAQRQEEVRMSWVFERSLLRESSTGFRLLVRALGGKVDRPAEVDESVRSMTVEQDDAELSCRTWVRDVLWRLEGDGVLARRKNSRGLDWEEIGRVCREYVARKRVQGRWDSSSAGKWDCSVSVPTWDMLRDRETVA